MSETSSPPVPPPLPPTTLKLNSPTKNLGDVSPTFTKLDICEWASGEPEFWEVCAKYNICLYKPPYRFKYRSFKSILQIGPTCGLVALSMLVNGEVTANEMISITKLEGYSNNGEMFSCENMIRLTEKVFSLAEIDNIKYSLKRGGLLSDEVIKKLLDGAVLLVPVTLPSKLCVMDSRDWDRVLLSDEARIFLYRKTNVGEYYEDEENALQRYDADFNNSPCLKNGHKAHWALVCGVIVIEEPKDCYASDPNNIYVLCKHGKSRYLTAWKLEELDRSNKNLWEFSPQREYDGLLYILPEGGVGGNNGLRDQFLIFEGF